MPAARLLSFLKVIERKMRSISKSTYITLAVGAVIGAFSMASMLKTNVLGKAQAAPGVGLAVASISPDRMDSIRSLDNTFADLVEAIEPSVVHIRTESKLAKDMFGRAMPSGGEGSGVVFRSDGWIVTNDHVVNGFEKVTVVLSDGREMLGQVRRAEDSDIAVIKVDAKDLPAATFADSSKVRQGQYAIAAGAPFGLENTVTIGHISALGRSPEVPDAKTTMGARYYPDMIQTDASINMGNSGGPLMNVDGQVVGINTAIYSGTGGNVGIGFAIPSNQARLIAEMLIEKGKITKGYMGVNPVNLKPFQKKDLKLDGGALVMEARNSEPAAVAGIKKDDVIVRIGESQVKGQIDVRNAMLRYEPGKSVDVEVVRAGEHKTFTVKLGTPPKNPTRSATPKGSNPLEQMPNMDDLLPKTAPSPDPEGDVTPLHEGKAKLGVRVQSLDAAARKQFNIPANVVGAIVAGVDENSVASKLGIQEGDVIQKIGDVTVQSGDDLVRAMSQVNWGDSKQVTWSRFKGNSRFEQSRTVEFK